MVTPNRPSLTHTSKMEKEGKCDTEKTKKRRMTNNKQRFDRRNAARGKMTLTAHGRLPTAYH